MKYTTEQLIAKIKEFDDAREALYEMIDRHRALEKNADEELNKISWDLREMQSDNELED